MWWPPGGVSAASHVQVSRILFHVLRIILYIQNHDDDIALELLIYMEIS